MTITKLEVSVITEVITQVKIMDGVTFVIDELLVFWVAAYYVDGCTSTIEG